VKTYQMFIEDSRYTVPTLKFVTAADGGRARNLAEATLLENKFHQGVEVYLSSLWLFGVGSLAGGRVEERPAAA